MTLFVERDQSHMFKYSMMWTHQIHWISNYFCHFHIFPPAADFSWWLISQKGSGWPFLNAQNRHECFDKAVSLSTTWSLVSTSMTQTVIMLPFAKIDHLAQVSAMYWLINPSVLLQVSRWVTWEVHLASETEGREWRLIVVLNYTYENTI